MLHCICLFGQSWMYGNLNSDSGSTQAGCNPSTTPCTIGTAIPLQVVVGILQRCEARLLEMADMEKMVAFLRTEVPQWRHDALQVSFPAA